MGILWWNIEIGIGNIVRPFFDFEKPIWTKDGQNIIIKSMPLEECDESAFYSFRDHQKDSDSNKMGFKTTRDIIVEDESIKRSWVNRYRADIVMIEIETGNPTPLCYGARPVGMALSNDGNYLAFTSCLGEERIDSQQIVYDLLILPIKTNIEVPCFYLNYREGKVPLVVRVYGGSMQSQNLRLFGLSPSAADNHQLFATRGYAVFLPDLPMSRSNEPANEIKEGIEAALEAISDHPDIDSERIGIIGHSFGGYSALVAITRLQQFKAAVVSSGRKFN